MKQNENRVVRLRPRSLDLERGVMDSRQRHGCGAPLRVPSAALLHEARAQERQIHPGIVLEEPHEIRLLDGEQVPLGRHPRRAR